MALFKNVNGQKWVVFAFNRTTNIPETGDAANITANLRLDGGAANAVDDVNPTELEDGYYVFDLTQIETNADNIIIAPVSGTGDIQVIGVPGAVWTDSVTAAVSALNNFDPAADAVANVTLVATTTTNTDMRGTDGANTVVPMTAALSQIEHDATQTSITGLNDIAATDIVSAGPITTLTGAVVNVDLVDVTTTNSDMRGTDGANTVVPPSVAQFNARTILSASYFDPVTDAVANVTLVATTTTNTDMRGTDGANTVVPPSVAQFNARTLAAASYFDPATDTVIVGTNNDKTGYTLSTAGLAQFMTVNTGEIAAVAGSVAQIAQGSAGGNVTVGAMTQAALAQFITDDTGEVCPPDAGSVALLSQCSSSAGAGSIAYPITVQENGSPVSGVKCWISTDIAGTNVVAGTLITDDFGLVTFLLDPGTYYLWRDSSFVCFPSPVLITVV